MAAVAVWLGALQPGGREGREERGARFLGPQRPAVTMVLSHGGRGVLCRLWKPLSRQRRWRGAEDGGVGKTTLIQKASEVLQSSGVPVDGFYTQEVRQGGRRIGFDVVTLSGARGPLSRVGSQPPPGKPQCRVGQYVVDLASFEQLALPVLRNAGPSRSPGHSVCVIDEIGKMELFSQPFVQAVCQTLSTPGTVVLGTIPVPKGKPLALVEEIRNRHDVKVFSVTKENRNSLLPDIVTCVQRSRT